MKRLILFIAFFGIAIGSLTADTLTVMQYNLMYYDKVYDDCNATTNNVDSKDDYLRTIIGFVRPDIFTANEINASVSSVERILVNTLNVDGESRYKRADFSGDFLVNMLYYNSDKLTLVSQDVIPTEPRETNVYKLQVKTASAKTDPIYLYCMVTHLKAGSYSDDEQTRSVAAAAIMNYISSRSISGNVLLMGDLNLYGDDEEAFVKLTSPVGSSGFKFSDPAGMVGAWHNSYAFRSVHSQSTHDGYNEECFSTGGMDDRFDFILSSPMLQSAEAGLRIIDYKVIAQDGERLNGSLISPTNTSVPPDVLNALYSMSDHLPVRLRLYYDATLTSVRHSALPAVRYNNPVEGNFRIRTSDGSNAISQISIYSPIGQSLLFKRYTTPVSTGTLNLTGFKDGLYLVRITFANKKQRMIKIIKRTR